MHALDGVSLTVKKGEFISIVGTSGSGKSTLLHMLGGLDRATEGEEFIDGVNIFTLKEEELTDFLLGDAEYFNSRFYSESQTISESFIQEVTKQPEFKEGEKDLTLLKQRLDTGDYIIVGVEMTDDGKIREEKHTFTNPIRSWRSEISCYTTESGFERLSNTKWTMSYALEVSDGMENGMEDFLDAYTTADEPQMSFESKSRWLDEYYSFQKMFVLIGYGMREFAMLKAIGMTGKQLISMVCLEGMYYAGGTVLLSGLFSLVVSATVIRSFSEMMWFTSYHFTMLPVLIVSPFLFGLGALIPAITEKLTQKRSIVEQLGRNEQSGLI